VTVVEITFVVLEVQLFEVEPNGLVIAKETSPEGRTPPAIPETVVVSVVVPFSVGFDDAAKVIIGTWWARVRVNWLLEAAA